MMLLAAALHWLQAHSVIAMIIVFALIAVQAYWPGNRARHEQHGMIPLRDDI